MRSLLTFSFAIVAGAAFTLPVPAHATGAPPGAGLTCGYSTFIDPVSTRSFVEVDGGPLVIADGADPRSGRLTCTLRLGYIGATTHTGGRFAAAITSPTMPGAVAITPQVVEYTPVGFEDPVVCTQVDIDGVGTFYWDDSASTWSTDPEVVCTDWHEDVPDCAHDPVCSTIDLVACTVFKAIAPGVPGVVDIDAEGDVALLGVGFWDCPPYGS